MLNRICRGATRLLTLLIVCAAPGAALADKTEPAPKVAASSLFPPVRERVLETELLRSKGGLEYKIFISRPSGPPPAGGFPIAYVVDGNAWFGVAAEVARLNEGASPMVVVGIGYPTQSLFDLHRRVRDFTMPAPANIGDPRLGPLKFGGVDDFMAFIRDTLKPFVQSKIQINTGKQALVGHSLGGLFTLTQLFRDPAAFQTYVAASPSIHLNNRAILTQAKEFVARKDKPADLRVLITVGLIEQDTGSKEEARMRGMIAARPQFFTGEKIDDVIAEWKATRMGERMVDNAREMAADLDAANVPTTFETFQNEDHMSAAIVGINRGIPFILKGK